MSSEALEARLDDLRQVCFAPSDGYSAGEWCEAANEGVQIALGLLAALAVARERAEALQHDRDSFGPFFLRDVARLVGLPDDASMDAIVDAFAVAREREQRAVEALDGLVAVTERAVALLDAHDSWLPEAEALSVALRAARAALVAAADEPGETPA